MLALAAVIVISLQSLAVIRRIVSVYIAPSWYILTALCTAAVEFLFTAETKRTCILTYSCDSFAAYLLIVTSLS